MNPQLNTLLVLAGALIVAPCWAQNAPAAVPSAPAIVTVPDMPPVTDPKNLYSESVAGRFSPTVSGDLVRVYVPNPIERGLRHRPATFRWFDKFKVGVNPQRVSCRRGSQDPLRRQQRRRPHRRQSYTRGSKDRQARQAAAGRRPLQHVFFARWQVGDHRRRGLEAPGFS